MSVRSAALAAVAVLSLAVGITPAAASGGAVEFHGSWHINCFGCGSTTGSATLAVTGVVNGVVLVAAPVTASFSSFNGTSPFDCLISGAANGTTTGAVNVSFGWNRVGAFAVVGVTGDINGGGVAVFQPTDPIGLICGSPVNGVVAGAVAGT